METTLKTAAYIWMAFCAISHTRYEAKKHNSDPSFKNLKWLYIINVIIYWVITASFI